MARSTPIGDASTKPDPTRTPLELTCPQCGASVPLDEPGQVRRCPSCKEKLGRVAQLDQLLARWYEPRRWRADLVKPSVTYLVERLWTANGQGERLYEGVSPRYTNYDIFRHLVTRLIVQGIDDGWVDLVFPPDPFVEDPKYELKIVDSERFASGVERLFPEVNWDEPVSLPPDMAAPARQTAGRPKKSKRRKR